MEELIQRAAEKLGYPADIVSRSAKARAEAEGITPEAVLAAWVGEEVAPAAPPPAAPAPAEPAPVEPAPVTEELAEEGPAVEILLPEVAPAGTPEEKPERREEEPEEAPEPVGASSAVPAWLSMSFFLIPLVAVIYALWVPNGPDCGDGGVLGIDPVTQEAVNCDGSAFGTSEVSFFAIGRELYGGECAACHAANGGGGGAFPALAGQAVLVTFPADQCGEHMDWVKLGTNNWPDPTYGAPGKPVGGSGAVMPTFEGELGEEDIAAVVLFERVQFGGQALDEALTDCGLDAEGEEGAEAVAQTE